MASTPFDLVYYDILGLTPLSPFSGYCYYVSFIDDYSRYTLVYLMQTRSYILNIYTDFIT